MGLFRHVSVALLLALVCGSRAAHAQGLNGTLVGTVKDAQGGVIPGALVQILSPALIGGARETTTSDRGQWLLPILPPGDYTLTVDLSPRFARQDSIQVGAEPRPCPKANTGGTGIAISRRISAVPSGATGSGSSARISISAITTVSLHRHGKPQHSAAPARRLALLLDRLVRANDADGMHAADIVRSDSGGMRIDRGAFWGGVPA
jgi:Carboxypeptidase regulatory-like domain